LLDDEWLPYEAVHEFQRRLAGLDQLELDEYRLKYTGQQVDEAVANEPLPAFSDTGRSLLQSRGVFGETLLHSCILRIGGTQEEDTRAMQRATALAEYVIKSCGKGQIVDLVNSQYDTCKRRAKGIWIDEFCTRPNCPHACSGDSYTGEYPSAQHASSNDTSMP